MEREREHEALSKIVIASCKVDRIAISNSICQPHKTGQTRAQP